MSVSNLEVEAPNAVLEKKAPEQERLFQPSPRSPRVVLEAARARDAAINNGLGDGAAVGETDPPVVAVEVDEK